MSKYIDKKIIEKLKKSLDLCVTKKDHNERTSSVSISKSGNHYYGGLIESDTNTFNISSEQVCLVLSTISNDYRVEKIITMLETPTSQNFISPLILKNIIDHQIRTGFNIEYTVVDVNGKILFHKENIQKYIPFYRPLPILLSRTNLKYSPYKIKSKVNNVKILKNTAILGLNKNFPLYESASGYASAVRTSKGNVYFAGQYSCPDKRLSLHSEVNAVIAALMNKDYKIMSLGLVSTKYKDTPCNLCGNCRQFISEINDKYGLNIQIHLFAMDNHKSKKYSLKEYLPGLWSSKKWQKN